MHIGRTGGGAKDSCSPPQLPGTQSYDSHISDEKCDILDVGIEALGLSP